MPEWLADSFQNSLDISVAVLGWRLVMAFALGCVVAGIYRWTHLGNEGYTPTFVSTLVLLAILIAMVTQVIGNNVARAFSLVGALSIVRFRTVVQDTRDTAFVIFSVVIGMASGAGHLYVALLGIGIVGLAAFVIRPQPPQMGRLNPECNLCVRLGIGSNPETLLANVLEKYLDAYRLQSTTTARQGAALELTYNARLRPRRSPTDFVNELNQLEGIQNVSLGLL